MKKVSPYGNMYSFLTHTWTPVRGACPYGCSYCYVNNWGNNHKPLHLDEKELRAIQGEGNFIFVCSGCDLFHPQVKKEWIELVLKKTRDYPKNKYLWHTKNPARVFEFREWFDLWSGIDDVLCVTVESNIPWPDISKAPQPYERIQYLKQWENKRMITVEPIMDFDFMTFFEMIISCDPEQVNIGADSGNNNLPEPSREKIRDLINKLASRTKVHLKKNLRRILPEHRLYAKTESVQPVG